MQLNMTRLKKNQLFENTDHHHNHIVQQYNRPLLSFTTAFLSLVAVLVLPLTGCRHSTTDRALDLAEALMQELPDSVEYQYDPKKALTIIDSIPKSELNSDAIRARHAFLKTMASYKAYDQFPSDSLMNIAVQYYERTGDHKKEARIKMYLGISAMYVGEFEKSQSYLLKAFEITSPEWMSLRGQISQALGELYYQTSHYKEAEKHINQACLTFTKAKMKGRLACAQLTKSRILVGMADLTNAAYYADSVLNYARTSGETGLADEARGDVAYIAFAQEDYNKALSHYDTLKSQKALTSLDSLIYTISEVKARDARKARELYSKLSKKSLSSDIGALVKYEMDNAEGDLRKSLTSLQALDSVETETTLKLHANMLDVSLTEELDKKAARQEDRIHSLSNRIWIIVILSVIAAAAIAVGIVIVLRRRHRAGIAAEQQKYAELKRQKNDAPEKLVGVILKDYGKNMKGKKGTSEGTDSEERAEEVFIDPLNIDDTKIARLEKILNENNDNVMVEFRKDFPKLKKQDYQLMILDASGFTIQQIHKIIGSKDATSAYNRKKRLRAAIETSQSPNIDRYLALLK